MSAFGRAGAHPAYRFSSCSGGLWETGCLAMCMMLVMLPFFILAMYEKHGQPLEKIVGNIIKVAGTLTQGAPV